MASLALGDLLSPIASILAFIEPGLEKNNNCPELIHNTETGQNPKKNR